MDRYENVSVVASTRGHLRIQIPQLYRSEQVKDRLEAELGNHPGVIEAHANPLTARLLIVFEPALQATVLLLELGFAVAPPEHEAAPERAPPPATPRAPPEHGVAARPAIYAPWHARTADEALAFHASSLRFGLSQAEADERLRHGLNTIPPPRRRSALEILLNQFKSMPIILLGVSAAVSALTGALAEAAAIGAVLVLNGAIGYFTERKAEAAIASLSELVDDIVTVQRDGEVRQIEASRVVPGDVLVLSPGTRIAADMRLLQASGLLVDESALTGESFPIGKFVAPLERILPLADRRNMAYRGTAVSMGSGLGLVVGTGSHTEVGAIQTLTSATERPRTPIQIQLDQLSNQLIKVSTGMCLGIFGLGLLRGYQRVGMFKTAIALAIAAVPEGLPAVATTSLARGIGRMRAQHVLIRHLHAVETIGAIQTICLDKTGTLTMNRMSAVAVRSVRHTLHAERAAIGQADAGAFELQRLLQICVLCNQADAHEALPDSPLQGSATENALLNLAARAGMQAAALRARFPLLSTELRAEGRNYMLTVHAMPGSQRRLVAVKGSPDEVLAMSASYLSGNEVCAFDEPTRQAVMQQNEEMAEQQLRVLGFAYAEGAAPEHAARDRSLTWVGLVGLADPLRPGVECVIERFHEAGIRTIMLTGDQAGTAYVIGKALHLNNGDALNVVNADELDHIEPERLRTLAANAHIFSRVTPSDKLRIVQAIRSAHTTVAMTGDGINDGPALRAADIGIAMGGGTEVALSVADVALEHDRLDGLLDAISQGRTISANIRKSLHFLLSSNLSEILVVFGSVALGTGQPLTPMQLLWLNLLTDMLPAIALAAEPAEPDVMNRAPRDARQRLVEPEEMWRYAREGAVLAGGTLSAYLYGVLRHGPGARAGTIAFDSMVLGQMLHALFCRSDRHRTFFDPGAAPNRRLMLAIASSLGLHALAHVVPGLRRLLGIAPLDLVDLLAILAGAGVPLLVNELGKPGVQSRQATRAKAERSTSRSTRVPTTLSATLSAIVEPEARA